ncbi:MAG: extracellular solute-binding protein [Promethearchaeota archaeon]
MIQKKKRMTQEKKVTGISRRGFIKAAGAGMVATGLGANIIIPGRVLAGRKKLKIFQIGFPQSFVEWFKTYAREWGERNDTEVIVDTGFWVSQNAVAEVKAQKGHDIHLLPWPAAFEGQVIDHREVYQECEKIYGKAIPFAVKNTYNPKTKKYFGFCDSYPPDPINYRKDLWDGVGMFPDTWENVRVGGAKIKKKYGNPVGIGLSKELDSSMVLRTILYSYGASVQDQEGNVVINSKQTLEAVKFVRALFEEAMVPEVLGWDAMSNNGFMLRGKGSLVVNAISVTRAAEKDKVMAEISKKIWLAKPPSGPVRRMGLPHFRNIYSIWKFAENIEGARQFLVDYIGDSRKAFLACEFYNFPCFPDTVPDLKKLIANDPKADPPDKYKVLEDAMEWTTNVGYPGYSNAATDETWGKMIIPEMFAKAATGELTPEDAIKEAEARCKDIFAKWKDRGLV